MKRALRETGVLIVLLAFGAGLGCGGPGDRQMETALQDILAPEKPAEVWAPLLAAPAPGGGPALRQALGGRNFTGWLLAAPLDAKDPLQTGFYEWKLLPDAKAMAGYLAHHGSLLAPPHIRELVWIEDPAATIRGSFLAVTPYGLTAKFLFAGARENGRIRIRRLAVPRKYSTGMQEAYPILSLD